MNRCSPAFCFFSFYGKMHIFAFSRNKKLNLSSIGTCFPKENPKEITAAIQDSVDINVPAVYSVENHIVAAHKEAIVPADISNRGQRSTHFRKILQAIDRIQNAVHHALCRHAVLALRHNIVPYVVQITAGLR